MFNPVALLPDVWPFWQYYFKFTLKIVRLQKAVTQDLVTQGDGPLRAPKRKVLGQISEKKDFTENLTKPIKQDIDYCRLIVSYTINHVSLSVVKRIGAC